MISYSIMAKELNHSIDAGDFHRVRAVRIFQTGTFNIGQMVELSPEAGLHVGVVLRMRAGERLTLFSGDNHEYQATIDTVQKKRVKVIIDGMTVMNRESPCALHLAQAMVKGDKMEWVIQKSVELGVTSVTPLLTERSVIRVDKDRMLKKQEQWQSIAIAACEQSGRNVVPVIHPWCAFDDFIQRCHSSVKLLLDPLSTTHWRELSLVAQDITLLIGPEGGLSDKEIERARAGEFMSLQLGPRVLRTETAAIAALSILQAVGGDL